MCFKFMKGWKNRMKIMLNVPYEEKNEAKVLGAKFDWDAKVWYCEDIADIKLFNKWLNKTNVICENLYIFKMNRDCFRCGKSSEVVLLATDRSYALEDNYKLNTNMQILTYLEWMPRKLGDYMEKLRYYPSYSKTVNSSYYMNHCPNCKCTHGDHFLHEVPNEAMYKHLFYKKSAPCRYSKIENSFCLPVKARLPHYDEVNSSMELLMLHLTHEDMENRASLNVTQKEINKLLPTSIREEDIVISGI